MHTVYVHHELGPGPAVTLAYRAPPHATLDDAIAALTSAAPALPTAAAAAPPRAALVRGGAPLDGARLCADLAPGSDVFIVHEAAVAEQEADEEEEEIEDETVLARASALAAAGDRAAAVRLLASTPGHRAAAAVIDHLLAAGRIATATEAAAAAAAMFPDSYPVALAAARVAAAAAAAAPPSAAADGDAVAALLDAFSAAVDVAQRGGDPGLDARAAAATAARGASDPDVADGVAAELAQVVLSVDETHVEALGVYAAVAAGQGLRAEAVQALLRVLPRTQAHAPANAVLADIASSPDGVAVIGAELAALGAAAAASPAVWGLLAASATAAGAPAAAAALLVRAADAAPAAPDVALARGRALEAAGDVAGAVGAVRDWCAAAAGRGGTLIAVLAAATAGLPPLDAPTAWLAADGWPEAGGGDPPAADLAPADVDAAPLAALAARALFTGGALSRAAAVVAALPDAALAARADAANERAFVLLLRALLADAARRSDGSQPPLFVAGDSHALVPAWRTVRVGGEARVAVPLLAPGATLWAARPSAPPSRRTAAWAGAVSRLPPAADAVVVCLGGLDAAEFLPRAAASLRYDGPASAARATAAAGVGGLVRLAEERGVSVYVHPVAGGAGEEGSPRAQLNAALARAVAAAATPAVRWLATESEAGLDGVHATPGAWLEGVERALDAAAE